MDVVGNNIANVNTTGYKTSNVVFQDLLSQQLKGGGAPIAGTTGGTNPSQVGLGVRLGGVTLNFAQGASQLTGRSTDFSIQGDGLFIVDQGGTRAYTRSGAFSLDGLGQLVTPDGGFIQGWQANAQGQVNTNSTITALKIPVGQTIAPVVSTFMKVGGNLPADTALGTNVNVSINVYNSLGSPVPLRGEFRKIADTAGAVNWELRTYDADEHLDLRPHPGVVQPDRHAHHAEREHHAGATQRDRRHHRHVDRGRHQLRPRHRDLGGPSHGLGEAEQRRRTVAGRLGDRVARRLQRLQRRPRQRCVLERSQPAARSDRPGGVHEPGGPREGRRLAVPLVGQLG